MYTVKLSRQALKDKEKLVKSHLSSKAKTLIDVIKANPYQTTPPYENLTGEFKDFYSRRINHQHRLVYTVHEAEKIVVVRSMWTYYE